MAAEIVRAHHVRKVGAASTEIAVAIVEASLRVSPITVAMVVVDKIHVRAMALVTRLRVATMTSAAISLATHRLAVHAASVGRAEMRTPATVDPDWKDLDRMK